MVVFVAKKKMLETIMFFSGTGFHLLTLDRKQSIYVDSLPNETLNQEPSLAPWSVRASLGDALTKAGLAKLNQSGGAVPVSSPTPLSLAST
jgi:hypothetical protein